MKRITMLAAAAFAVAALVGPTSAFAGKAHYLGTYKVEKHLDIEGESQTYTVSCNNGDIALDGMWRFDNVDQDNDYEAFGPPGFGTTGNKAFDVLESVFVRAAYATSVSTYRFEFLPLAGGDVQGKLMLTCLPDPTPPVGGHTHPWDVDAALSETTEFTAPAAGQFSASDDVCNSGLGTEIAIQPGFRFEGTTGYAATTHPGNGSVVKRWPNSTSTVTQWDWVFDLDDQARFKLSHRCLRLKSDPASSGPVHSHKIVKSFAPKSPTPGHFQTVVKNRVNELQVHCGELYKGVIGAWDFLTFGGYTKLWYLGMDPRPKTRAFKVLNADPLNNYSVKFGLVCFKDKTT